MIDRAISFKQGVSCFLFGPRGTGKTYLLRRLFPDAVFIDLLEARTFNQLSADPQRLQSLVGAVPHGPVIVDEVQKLPALLDEVHRLMELNNRWFILTGSSARKLRRAGVNLLGGRAETRHLHPLTATELGKDFDLAEALEFGLLPSLYDSAKNITPADYLQSYVQTYLREEVQQEGFTRSLGSFSRFLEAASFAQGQLLNTAELARECQIKRKLAESYFAILEDLLLGYRLPSFQRRARRRVTQHHKFFFFDAGVYRAIRPRGLLDSPEEIDGCCIETLVFQQLRALLSYRRSEATLSYWRTTTGLEVDFVVYGRGIFTAIEVKRKRTITGRDCRGLRAFHDEYPEATRIILHGGDREELIDGIRAIPLVQALPDMESIIWPG